jgi:excisionase family DNA binding protein
MEDILLTIGEVAKYLRVSRETVYIYARQGKIPCFKVFNKWRFPENALKEWQGSQVKMNGKEGVK